MTREINNASSNSEKDKTMRKIKFVLNPSPKTPETGSSLSFLSLEEVRKVRTFHESFKEYNPTPLVELPNLASNLNVAHILVKDESHRFGLNAFKVLGASYAIGRYLAEKLWIDISKITFENLNSQEARRRLGQITFTTATDGNHGRAVAWAAQQLGLKSVIYMPRGSDTARLANIRSHGAEATITDLNYDDAVRHAYRMAQERGWVAIQDTSWPGYENIPTWIMQGYTTLAMEALEQLDDKGIYSPTHIFLQAGVGSFAGSILGFLKTALRDKQILTAIVEPNKADCIYQSAKAGDGKPHKVEGDLDTMMAGLACGEPNTLSWKILRDYAHAYISCPDWVAANGMRILAAPLQGDPPIVSGESGAVTCGILEYIMGQPEGKNLRKALKMDKNSIILLVSTEGDTSPQTYREVTWYGKYPGIIK